MQSDLHMLLTQAPLQLDDQDLQEIVLESPAGQRRRIDVEVGFCVFEVKRDLRTGNVREDAVVQLAGYVSSRREQTGQRYVGVLADGAEWHLYHLVGESLELVSSLHTDVRNFEPDTLFVWLEGVLATGEKITPTAREIEQRLGAGSAAHALEFAELRALYERHRDDPGLVLKRKLWTKLLTTALGTNFRGEDDLFVEHTLLVAMAEIIGHAVVGLDPTDQSITPVTLLSGRLFASHEIGGVIESDFFDWPAEVAGGEPFVRGLARRLARFAWAHVETDVMKVLYESVIDAEQRHSLGEYYTPDWLAEIVVEETVTDALTERVLDPSCGSGTFLFHAVRRYIAAGEAAGMGIGEMLTGVTSKVLGMDVHPVAVTLARITYLLAIGPERLAHDDRPAFSVPVYLGDSMQWGQQNTLMNTDALSVPTDGGQLFDDDLLFPHRLLHDAGRFDRLVAELADRAAARAPGSPVPSLKATFRLFAVHDDDQPMLTATFAKMCELHDTGRDHIWGYYIRNLARPLSLADSANRVDVMVGNPPWLAYRYMPPQMKSEFREMSTARGFWAGAAVATNQDLSALFVARATELYLRNAGRFAFVMPLAVLTRNQYAGFRSGRWSPGGTGGGAANVNAALDTAWDLHAVKPAFFPVPASVIRGHRTTEHGSTAPGTENWAGRISRRNAPLPIARPALTRAAATTAASGERSPYAARFTQGAILVPRFLVLVEPKSTGPFGAGAGRRMVGSRRSSNEKKPWKDLPALSGAVEKQFVRPIHLGDTILPFREQEPFLGVIPWDGRQLLQGSDDTIDLYPGFADWWRAAENTWNTYRSTDKLSLLDQLDYRRKLRAQFPAGEHRVVYTKGGMYLAAARVSDPSAVIDHKLYWAATSSIDEARYLTAILNSPALLELVRPLQGRGEHNPRDFDKYVFQIPFPLYDADNNHHQRIADLAASAETVAAAVEVPNTSFQTQRRAVRRALEDDGVAASIDGEIAALLGPTG
ncbi:restriction endonuclease [Pseudonocardia sp. UM4_GMWB1]|uniref:N-6 DNA methylase n=1 Tax=Pseudonocardia sp. UM4_GMWB1 TaxID=2212989 RepID=UPI00307F441C